MLQHGPRYPEIFGIEPVNDSVIVPAERLHAITPSSRYMAQDDNLHPRSLSPGELRDQPQQHIARVRVVQVEPEVEVIAVLGVQGDDSEPF